MKFKTQLKSATALPAIAALTGLALTIATAGVGMARPGAAPAENPTAVPAPAHAPERLAMGEKPKNGCSPCNPCGGCNPCNPCAAANPCAAGGCGGCNPCNPCAGANPCAASNPCAAGGCGGCNPCNPCAGGASDGEVSAEDARAAYAGASEALKAAFGGSKEPGAADYLGWTSFSTGPYASGTHGGRLVSNYGNDLAAAYGKYEDAGVFPEGAIIAKDSITVGANGKATIGPLFLMEKMQAGFNSDYGDWKYTLVLPNGKTMGVTNGKNSAGVQFCADCHVAVEDQDHMFFIPEDYRK